MAIRKDECARIALHTYGNEIGSLLRTGNLEQFIKNLLSGKTSLSSETILPGLSIGFDAGRLKKSGITTDELRRNGFLNGADLLNIHSLLEALLPSRPSAGLSPGLEAATNG